MAMPSRHTGGYLPDRDAPVTGEIAKAAAALRDPRGLTRRQAREALVEIGHPALPALLTALEDPNNQVRWEAAKALGEIGDPSTIEPLLRAMEDYEPEIRWLAGEALVAIGPRVIVPLLAALTQKGDLAQFRAAAHHVLRSVEARGVDGEIHHVLEALDGFDPAVQAPIAAGRALVKISDENLRALNEELSAD